MKKLNQILFFIIFILINACSKDYEHIKDKIADPYLYHSLTKELTDVIVYDIFSPPVASRIYAYPNIAAYEILIHKSEQYRSLSGILTDLQPIPNSNKKIALPIAAFQAYLVVSKKFLFSEEKIQTFSKDFYKKIKATGISNRLFKHSIQYGNIVAKHILDWAEEDNYKQTRTYSKYTLKQELEAWKPTPPDYMEGIEPHWNKIRPFIIDSATQFIPDLPTSFSMKKHSKFYRELLEVYNTGVNLTAQQKAIAEFWDCNPYVSHHMGHAMFATKKITPGGHWIGITGIACRSKSLDLIQTVEAYTRVSIALADAFISCWDEKWRSILVRPETLINEYIDEKWMPLLQTPPFPEYTSGHSVISTAAATILTDLFGEPFYLSDSTEVEYGLPVRNFDSFFQASEEAAISRLYGGIHYMPAIKNGIKQGKAIGQFIVKKLHTRLKN